MARTVEDVELLFRVVAGFDSGDAFLDQDQGAVEVVREVPVPVRATGDPQVLGWLVFVVGSTCLGLELVGFVNQGALGAPLAVIFGARARGKGR